MIPHRTNRRERQSYHIEQKRPIPWKYFYSNNVHNKECPLNNHPLHYIDSCHIWTEHVDKRYNRTEFYHRRKGIADWKHDEYRNQIKCMMYKIGGVISIRHKHRYNIHICNKETAHRQGAISNPNHEHICIQPLFIHCSLQQISKAITQHRINKPLHDREAGILKSIEEQTQHIAKCRLAEICKASQKVACYLQNQGEGQHDRNGCFTFFQ